MYTLNYISTSLRCTCTVHVHFILHKYIPYMCMYTLYCISTSLICTCTVHVPFILHKYTLVVVVFPRRLETQQQQVHMYMYSTCTYKGVLM